MKKEEFKQFVRQNPGLIKYVKSGEMSWQKYYEIYDLYGENDEVWKPYLKKEETTQTTVNTDSTNSFLNFLKTIDLDNLQETIGSLQRVLGVFGDLAPKTNDKPIQEYKPRPLYKHFDD